MNMIFFFDYEPLAAASIGQGNRLNCIKCFFLQPIVLMVLFSVVQEAGTEEK